MKFVTATGSLYEINTDSKQIRRLNGAKDPTPRQGKDGAWRSFAKTYPDPIQVGESVLIAWGSDCDILPETMGGGFVLPTTVTSPVAEILPD